MQWQTTITIPALPDKLNYRTPALFAGSCFAASIGEAMKQRRFPVTVNPFGALYNPCSVAQCLRRLRTCRTFAEGELFRAHGLWTTFAHHSLFAHPDRATFLRQANDALEKGHEAWRTARAIVVSLGTSWAYRHRESNRIVANCHKRPDSEFERLFLSSEETVAMLADEIGAKQDCLWLLTVSPVRHWNDGAHGNQLSKAHLLVAVETLRQRFPTRCYYFPAYEIMMDELRDYRFYAADMRHPSAQAIDYIWQRFAAAAFDDETRTIMREVEKLAAARQHRPLHPDTEEHRLFAETLKNQLRAFAERYPFVTTEE
ncbi:MAG: GSCFA domain-containing protein [Prevotellaceae bacterium]|jgi:hypothetical protein|nr:GSCFA domain-containing protein [Prevotellaceae bacterium]